MFHVKRPASRILEARAALFSLGALSALSELLLLREVLFLGGGTELAAAAMLASWLLAGAAGAYWASYARRAPGLPALLVLGGAILPAQVFALRMLRAVLSGPAGELPSVFAMLLLGALVAAPLPVVLGAVFPLAARRLGFSGGAKAYVTETLGLGAGAGLTLALAGFRLEHHALAAVSSLFFLCAGLIWHKKALAAAALIPAVLALSGLWGMLERETTALAFGFERVESLVSTPHGRAFSVRTRRTHIYSGGLSEVPLASASETVELVLAAVPGTRRALVVCDDPEGYAAAFGSFPGVQATVLAPDPGMLEFRRGVRSFDTRANVAVAAREPLQYLRSDVAADTVILTAGAPLTAQNNRLFTASFFSLVRSRLPAEGVLAVELPYSPGHVSGDLAALAGSVWQTLGEVFNNRRIALARRAGTILLLASAGCDLDAAKPTPSPHRDARRREIGLYEPVDFAGAYDSTRTRLVREMLDSRAWPVNTVTEPASYKLAVAYSHRRFGPPGVLEWLWKLRFWHWLAAAAGASVILVLIARKGHSRVGPASAALGGGLCAMVAQVTVIYVFQSAHGLLYSHVGLLAGAFMLGALCGALRFKRSSGALRAFAVLAGLAVFTAALPFLLSAFASSGHFAARYLAFPAVSAAAGFLTGALFPACANLVPLRAAGRIYAADLAGASAGALFGGLVLVPSLGLYSAALLTGAAGVLLALPLAPAIIARAFGHRISG